MDKTELPKIFFIVLAVFLNGLAGLAGGLIPHKFLHRHLTTFLAFAAGTLLAVSFLDLLAEDIALGGEIEGHTEKVLGFTLIGFLVFYLVHSALGSHATGQSGHRHHHHGTGPLLLLGDALHNMTDGIAIAAAFYVSPETGIATTLAVVLHELPQEISDYTILLANGYTRTRALLSLVIVQLSALFGAFVFILLANSVPQVTVVALSLSAGGFLYIAAADLLPELQRNKSDSKWYVSVLALLFGIALIFVTEHIR